MKHLIISVIFAVFLTSGLFPDAENKHKYSPDGTLTIVLEDKSKFENQDLFDSEIAYDPSNKTGDVFPFSKKDLVLKIIGLKDEKKGLQIDVGGVPIKIENFDTASDGGRFITINAFQITKIVKAGDTDKKINEMIKNPRNLKILVKYGTNTLLNITLKNDIVYSQYPIYDAIELASKEISPKTKLQILYKYGIKENLEKNEILNSLSPEIPKSLIVFLIDSIVNAQMLLLKISFSIMNIPPNNATIAIDLQTTENTIRTELNSVKLTLSESVSNQTVASDAKSQPGLSVATAVDALAKFMAKRVKAELSSAFFQKFKEDICKPGFKPLAQLFPETHRLLLAIGEEIYNFHSYIEQLREAFHKDLNDIYSKIYILLIENDDIFENKAWLKSMLLSASYLIEGISKKKNPGEIVENASFDDILVNLTAPSQDSTVLEKKKFANIHNAGSCLKILQLLSVSLREQDKGKEHYWVNKDSLKKLLEDTDGNYLTLKYYLALLYQQAMDKDIKVYTLSKDNNYKETLKGITLENILDTIAKAEGKFEETKRIMENLTTKVTALENFLDEAREVEDEKNLKYENIYNSLNAFLDTVECASDLYDYLMNTFENEEKESNFKKNKEELNRYITISRCLGEIYLDVNRKNYNMVIFNLVKIFEKVFVEAADCQPQENGHPIRLEELEKNIAKIQKIIDDLESKPNSNNGTTTTQEYNDLNITLKSEKLTFRKRSFSKIVSLIAKYGTFMTAAIASKNSDQLESAIESIVLPPGSSAVKKNSIFNIALNGYVGFFFGNENQRGIKDGKRLNTIGVCAPIGVAFSFGSNSKNRSSLSLFVSIIDIGAVTALRFKKESDPAKSETLPTLKLENIIAPGFYLVHGLRKCPISLGMGIQYGPQLRKITPNSDTPTQNDAVICKSAVRFSVFIAVDIPLINFYTKAKE